MSKNRLSGATQPERREWASRIKALRQESGLKQEELAEQARVSRVTVSNIERGTVVPQEDILRRLLAVLGVETDEVDFEPQTELWLTMLGTLIEAIPEEERPPAVDGAVRTLASAVRKRASPDATTVGTNEHTADVDEFALAADTADHSPDEDLRTP